MSDSEEQISKLSWEDGENESEYQQEDDGFIDDRPLSEIEEKPILKKRKKHRPWGSDEEELGEEDLVNIHTAADTLRKKRIKKYREKTKEESLQMFDDELSDYESQSKPELSEESHSKQKSASIFKAIFESSDTEEEKVGVKEERKNTNQEEDLELIIRNPNPMGKLTDSCWKREVTEVDIPERLYIRLKDRLDPTSHELEWEARWIFRYKNNWESLENSEERIIISIQKVLSLFRKEYFDIPFITTYRYHLFQKDLQKSEIYEIYELDLEWANFSKTKKNILKRFREIQTKIQGHEEIEQCIGKAITTNDLHDISQYIIFCKNFIPSFQAEISRSRDQRRKSYLWVTENGVDKFAKDISMPPHELVQNLRGAKWLNKAPRQTEKPSELARKYIWKRYPDVLGVLVLIWSLIGDEMASHPSIKKFVRERYLQGLKISTVPTKKGETELNCFHPDYRIKRLKTVPLEKFKDDTWLRILRAEERRLIQIKYEHEEVLQEIINEISTYYQCSDSSALHKEEWRTFYTEIIQWTIRK